MFLDKNIGSVDGVHGRVSGLRSPTETSTPRSIALGVDGSVGGVGWVSSERVILRPDFLFWFLARKNREGAVAEWRAVAASCCPQAGVQRPFEQDAVRAGPKRLPTATLPPGRPAPVESRREEFRGRERRSQDCLPREGHESSPRQVRRFATWVAFSFALLWRFQGFRPAPPL